MRFRRPILFPSVHQELENSQARLTLFIFLPRSYLSREASAAAEKPRGS